MLTGGIGAGKSAVLEGLVELGAECIDADRLVSSLQQPGQHVYSEIVKQFGTSIVDDSGALDRAALAQLVFGNTKNLAALEGIVHPAVRSQISDQLARFRNLPPSAKPVIVVIDIPLIIDRSSLYGAVGLIVVDCPVEVVVQRLVENRGMSKSEATARIDSQISRAERLKLADFVVDNSETKIELSREINRCWAWMNSQVFDSSD